MTWKKGSRNGLASKNWTADELIEEINGMDVNDYESVINWLLGLEISKIVYLANQATRIPLVVKAMAVAINQDLNQRRGTFLSDLLNRVMARKLPRDNNISASTAPQLMIEVAEDSDVDEIDKI